MTATHNFDGDDDNDLESSSSRHLLCAKPGADQNLDDDGAMEASKHVDSHYNGHVESQRVMLSELLPRQNSLRLIIVGLAGVMVGILLSGVGSGETLPPPATINSFPKETGDQSCSANVTPSVYLLEVAQNRSRDYDTFVDPKYKQLVTGLAAFDNFAPTFEPELEWKTTHFPDINILGLPKAGSSQLYNILISHPRFRKFHWHSEFCFNLEDEDVNELVYPALGQANGSGLEMQKIQQRLKIANNPVLHANKAMHTQWENLNMEKNEGAVTVNKCLSPQKYWLQRQYLKKDLLSTPKPQRGKTILLLRDPAEWLWSAWNFWQQVPFEDVQPAHKNNWAMPPYQYRSPELFQEYMLAGERLQSSQHLLQNFRDNYVATAHRILADNFVINDDFIVLKSEDMLPDRIESSGFLDKLASFLGVAKINFDTSVLHSYSNCGNNKGLQNHDCGTDVEAGPSMAYDISGGRPMRNETRALVYLQFAEECQLWKESFGIEYEACLSVRAKYVVD